jgi:hypothetical protein
LSVGNADGWIDGQAEPGIREEERPYRKHTYVRPSLPMMATCSLPVPSHHVQILNLYDTIIREQLQACQGSAQKETVKDRDARREDGVSLARHSPTVGVGSTRCGPFACVAALVGSRG